MEQADISEDEIDSIICATITPDMLFPATACLVQQKLARNAPPPSTWKPPAQAFLRHGNRPAIHYLGNLRYRTGDRRGKLSTIIDWEDRSTCVLFGDGAGAAILRSRGEEAGHGILTTCMGADGSQSDILLMPVRRALSRDERIGQRTHASSQDVREKKRSRAPSSRCRPPPKKRCAAAT